MGSLDSQIKPLSLWDESIAPVQAQEEAPHLHTGTFLI